ncbi:hypothetical protein [Fischerella muscicola]|uniref:hypothetical protein n=1 Tax=Fischerella muscicola TaxID=92938 RepID=UPI0011AEF4B9|nr:hypothetical protein [Fischerella muscicola]
MKVGTTTKRSPLTEKQNNFMLQRLSKVRSLGVKPISSKKIFTLVLYKRRNLHKAKENYRLRSRF